MPLASPELQRMKMLLLATQAKPALEHLKRLVRHWELPTSPGQDAINRAIVRAIDEVQRRLDTLIRI